MEGITGGGGGAQRRFGDEQSSLFDQFERQAIELQLNRVILGRSSSESSVIRSSFAAAAAAPPSPLAPPPQKKLQVQQAGMTRRSGLQKLLKKLLKPILGTGWKRQGKREDPNLNDPLHWKTLSRSLRV
ncbi:hypothetical protein BVC80_1837g87 [Macleaya cordata]|uniref:Uncharacterized protein n=1 Tax=Macleaya cordata TaxID=56857 RepID=A0A200R3J1_MACCD|nr:hypothetical protein BVC80_1837g87 [Macleaya cordata]